MSVSIYNVNFDNLTRRELEQILIQWLAGHEQKMVFTPNPEMLLKSKDDREFKNLLNQSNLSIPDGVGLNYAYRAFGGTESLHRHTGVDSLQMLASLCHKHNLPMVLLGGGFESANLASEALMKNHIGLNCVGIDPGVVRMSEDGKVIMPQSVLEQIRFSGPAVLAVALGQGKQERFISQYLSSLPSVRIAIGVGGALEMIAGKLPRAPKPMQSAGLEWLWRVIIEPRRAGRIYRASVKFPILVATDTVRQGRFINACGSVLPEVVRQLFSRS
ncbi:MAG: WecB/TagA/CpsF family glycosyltransferase [Candidatus Uhrbacteria bacterium]|nr:WecB/TagA/CpsF family glycosyltransferase [Candidatus Uhrbacteria bacterium]